MYNDQVSQKQVEIIRYIQQNQTDMNKFFKDMKFKSQQFKQNTQTNKAKQQNTNNQKTNNQNKPKPKPINYSLNYRGQKIYSVQDLRKNYQNAIFGTKWWQLPYGRRDILGKIQFWLGASFIFTFIDKKIQKLPFKFYRNTYGVFALLSVVYAFGQSLMFEPYCDINSYHYKPNENALIAKDIKRQLRQISGKK